jgi:hypothetical protein
MVGKGNEEAESSCHRSLCGHSAKATVKVWADCMLQHSKNNFMSPTEVHGRDQTHSLL